MPFNIARKTFMFRGMKNCLFVAIVAMEVVVFTISVHKRTGGVLPSVVQELGIVN